MINMTLFHLRCFRITCCLHCVIFQVHGFGGQDEARKLEKRASRVELQSCEQRNNKQTNMILRFYMYVYILDNTVRCKYIYIDLKKIHKLHAVERKTHFKQDVVMFILERPNLP